MTNPTPKNTVSEPTTNTPLNPAAASTAAKAKSAPASKVEPKAPLKAAAKPSSKQVAVKQDKVKKPKMVRDSFTFPKDEYTVLDALKLRAAKLGNPVKKTELLRAGIKAIAAMPDAKFLAALQAVPSIKTGRPAKPEAD
jgi:hypothetical protein